jgi:hypothetical protein
MGVKENWKNRKPTDEQKQDFSRLQAFHSSLTCKTPRKPVEMTVRDSILANETTPQAM